MGRYALFSTLFIGRFLVMNTNPFAYQAVLPLPTVSSNESYSLNPSPLLLPTCVGEECFAGTHFLTVKADKKRTLLLVEQERGVLLEKVIFLMISEVERRLPKHDFVRVHRSHLVNKHSIVRYEHNGKDGLIWLAGLKEPLVVSRTYKKAFLREMRGIPQLEFK
jgi:hypothetical protein